MKIKITFNDEHIALIKALNFERIDFNNIIKSFEQYNKHVGVINDPNAAIQAYKEQNIDGVMNSFDDCTLGDIIDKYHIGIDGIYGIDNFNMWGGTYIWEQMAYILGINDHVIKGTEEDPTGPKYPEEDMEHMRDLDAFMVTHLEHIFQIMIQFCTEGIQPGITYWCYDYEKIWHKA